ncbi:MAG: toll-Interleukin receptor [Deltaproteobacteria bacterium]|nr:MAG: toll-Interleukin receptor [Deltaproteobacteria bacterium]
MGQINGLKLFISYSHQDNTDENPFIKEFKKYITPLKDKGLIKDWYDREIFAGTEFQERIDNNLDNADIICLFLSADFLASPSCKIERDRAIEMRKMKGIPVIPIILRPCGWLDDPQVSSLLALPTDGKPISQFEDKDKAWHDVYNGLKRIIEMEMKIRKLRLSKEFSDFLNDTGLLEGAHPKKEKVTLEDILVYPELDKYDDFGELEKRINFREVIEKFPDYSRLVIAGEELSGKTTLCKAIFKELRTKNFIPIYIRGANFSGKLENKIRSAFNEQYEETELDLDDIDRIRIVPILDDLHLIKNKEKCIEGLIVYPRCVVTVDDIFTMNIRDEKLVSDFIHFKIRELKASLRYELIRKWAGIIDGEDINQYKDIDKYTELIDSTLGKSFGRGVMPSYPFFILSAIITYETFAMPLEQEITSQGYCYQALIYLYLRKNGVRNDEIDIYINFLTELAFYIYCEGKSELYPQDFEFFIKSYKSKYNLPISIEVLLRNLKRIIKIDSFANYSFRYPYLYYFFVAKYMVEHIEKCKGEIEKIINNLNIDEYAYIAVFMVHHSKDKNILDELILNALCLFDGYEPATLSKSEMDFFDRQSDIIIKAALPSGRTMPDEERERELKIKDELEEKQTDDSDSVRKDDRSDVRELRRAIKTVEVIGCIMKNRSGSLERSALENLFEEGVNVLLRFLSFYLEIIGIEDNQESMTESISERLNKIISKKKKMPLEEDLRKMARIIFWNINFLVVYGILAKLTHSLGSDKLIEIVTKVCDKIGTPASFCIKHGVLMWYNKNIQINEIARRFKDDDFSDIAKNAIRLMVVNHCYLHPVSHKDRQKAGSKLGIPIKRLMEASYSE